MSKRPCYFKASDGIPLYGVYHEPVTPTFAPVLITTSLFEERKSAYSTLYQLANQLEKSGHAVLRFDFRGSGESGGDSGCRKWRDLTSDLKDAGDFLKEQSGASLFHLIGLRLGASICIEEAIRLKPITLTAIAPVIRSRRRSR